MSSIASVIEEFPSNLRTPVQHLYSVIREDIGVPREDFTELTATVGRLADAQERTEARVEDLAKAQERTEARLNDLSVTVSDLSATVGRLADAQERTEAHLNDLSATVDKLAATVDAGIKSLYDANATLGSRWGVMSEATFRNTIRGILSKDGYTVERGYYGDREVDVVIQNGSHIILEITSSMRSKDVRSIIASAKDYEAKTGIKPRMMVAAIYVPSAALQALREEGSEIELFTHDEGGDAPA